jgi:hypothetical protein
LAHLSPGHYTITEHSPSSGAGRWTTVRVTCDGAKQSPGKPVHVTVSSSQTTTCVFVNVFIPAGAISLAKITTGSTGSVNFLVGGPARQIQQYHQNAQTTKQRLPASAHPNSSADSTAHLPLGLYVITEQPTAGENPRNWSVDSVKCNGQLVPFFRGAIAIRLTAAHPRLRCVYTNRFHAKPTPPPPPPPVPPSPPGPPPPNPPVPAYPTTDLSVTKHALQSAVAKGDPVTYVITVHNNGPDAASHVVLADQPRGKAKIISVRPSSGQCTIGKLVVCRLGDINAGSTVSIRVKLIPETNGTQFVNRAVVGGATAEATITNNLSHATIKVLHPPTSPVACGSRFDPVAYAAC